MPRAIHTITGLVVDVPEHILESELGQNVYIEVPEGTKPLTPGLFKPGNVEEFKANNKDFSKADESDNKDKKEVSNVE